MRPKIRLCHQLLVQHTQQTVPVRLQLAHVLAFLHFLRLSGCVSHIISHGIESVRDDLQRPLHLRLHAYHTTILTPSKCAPTQSRTFCSGGSAVTSDDDILLFIGDDLMDGCAHTGKSRRGQSVFVYKRSPEQCRRARHHSPRNCHLNPSCDAAFRNSQRDGIEQESLAADSTVRRVYPLQKAHSAMLAVPGYSGFRRLHEDRNAISSDPGVSDATRHSKFSLAASAVLQKPDTVSSSYTTLTAAASSTLRPTDYKVPDRTGVYVKPPPEAKLIGVSLYSSTFPNYFAEVWAMFSCSCTVVVFAWRSAPHVHPSVR